MIFFFCFFGPSRSTGTESGDSEHTLQADGKVCAESVHFTKVLRGWRMNCEVPLCV